VTVANGVVELDDDFSAFIVHEDCSNDALMLLSVDLSTLLREPGRMFDDVYPALYEIALRLDRVQDALAQARPFPFNRFIPPTGRVFDMQPAPGGAVLP
jgi:hypothetical protein